MKNSIIQSLYQQSTDITYNCTRTLADHLTNFNNIGKNALNHFTSASKNLNYATQLYYVVQVVSYVGGNYVLQGNYTLQTANNMIHCLSALDTQLNMLGRTATGLLNTSTTIAKVLNSTSTYLKPDMKHNYTSTRDGNLTKSNSIGEKSPNYLAYISKELKYATQLRHVTKVLSYISDDDTLQTMNNLGTELNKLSRVGTNLLNTSTTIAKILGSTSTYFKNVATSVKDFVIEHPSISMRHDKDELVYPYKIASIVPTGTVAETVNTNDAEAYDTSISSEESMYYSLDSTEAHDATISDEESMYYSLDGTEAHDATISDEESMYYSLDSTVNAPQNSIAVKILPHHVGKKLPLGNDLVDLERDGWDLCSDSNNINPEHDHTALENDLIDLEGDSWDFCLDADDINSESDDHAGSSDCNLPAVPTTIDYYNYSDTEEWVILGSDM